MDQRAAQIAAELAAQFESRLKADLKKHLATADAADTAPLSLSQLEKTVEALHQGPVAAPVHGEEEDDSEWEEVELEPSVWSNVLLCGTVPGEGWLSSALLLVLLMINTAIQAIFCFIVYEALSTASITENTVVQYRVWRRNVAHDLRYYNAASQKSLAKRVCDNDAGLEMSGEQASVAYNLFAYLGDGDGRDMSAIGTLMSSLALVIWTLSVVRELQAVCTMSRAVCAIPRRGRTRCSLVGDGAGTQMC